MRVALAIPLIVVLYLLSFGPAQLFLGMPATYPLLDFIYRPVIQLSRTSVGPSVHQYASFWRLEIANTGNYSTPDPGEEIVWFIRPTL